MTAIDLIATSRNLDFAGRVLMLAFKAAQQVASEDPTTPEHETRVLYAQRIMRGDEHQQLIAAHLIASNPTIAATIESNPTLLGANVPDGDIEFALGGIWTARALAFKDSRIGIVP